MQLSFYMCWVVITLNRLIDDEVDPCCLVIGFIMEKWLSSF